VYSLFSEQDILEIQKTIEEAYRTLSNDTLRKRYDQSHGQAPDEAKSEEPLEVKEVPREQEAPLSFTDISIPSVEGPYRGKTLKALRERMGINLENISKETKINTKILEYIEEEVREKLPAEVYLKGFLKGYARMLRLDPQKVIEGYLRFLNEAKKK
jgi:flagellar biosynthesis protein FlhG